MNFETAFRQKFSQDVSCKRTAKGMVQLSLAEAADISLRQVQNIESGKSMPKADTFLRLLRILELDPNEYNILLNHSQNDDIS